MLNLNEIEKDCREIRDTYAMAARAHIWLPALVAELTQAREELAAVDESLGDFYAPVLDPETEEPCGSFWKDHGVNVMRQELEQARAEIEHLRAFVPSPELMQRLAHLDEDYARHVDEAPAGDEYYSYAELPQAWRIEETQE